MKKKLRRGAGRPAAKKRETPASRKAAKVAKAHAIEASRHAVLATRTVNELAECELCGAGLGKPCTDGEGPLRADLAHNVRIAAAEEARFSGLPATKKPVDLAALKAPGTLELLDPAKIELNPHNPRVAPADAEAQAAFERSVAEQGVLEPVLVRPNEPVAVKAGRAPYQLVAGERRLKAAIVAVRAKALPAAYRIPAVVKPLDNRQALIVALTENLARADMHPLDEAEAFAKLAANGVGTAEIAAAVNRTQRLVQQRIKVAKDLPAEGKEAMRTPVKGRAYAEPQGGSAQSTAEGRATWTLSFSQAHAIAAIDDPAVKARTLRDVLADYNPARCGEDWIKRHAETIQRSRARGKDRKKGAAAALRPAPAEKAFAYPAPGKDGAWAWPKRFVWPGGMEDAKHGLEVLRVRTCALAVKARAGNDSGVGSNAHLYAGAYAVKLGAFPEIVEPIVEAHGLAHQWGVRRAALERAIEMMLKEFATPARAAADPRQARALIRDLAKLVDDVDDPKAQKALGDGLDAATAAMFSPAPADAAGDIDIPKFLDRRDEPPAAKDSSATGKNAPVAAPVDSAHVDQAPLTRKLETVIVGVADDTSRAAARLLDALEAAGLDLQLCRGDDHALSAAYRALCRALGRTPAIAGPAAGKKG